MYLFFGIGLCSSFFRVLEGFDGVLVCLPGEFVGSEVIAFAVGCGCGLVGVGGFVMVFGGAIVRALRHMCCPLVIGCNFVEATR
jgi:hypothetical protein